MEAGTGRLTLTLLGTGTSQGVPVIGCNCPVCTSHNPRNHRLRSSALIKMGDSCIVIDAGPDFRQQMLREKVQHVDAILLTHEHNDHVIGLDDIRPLNFRSGHAMTVYCMPRVGAELKSRFHYIFGAHIPGLPRIDLHKIEAGRTLKIGALFVQPIDILHGKLPILGFRMGSVAYLTDVKTIPEASINQLKGVKYLIISALHHDEHPAHLNLAQALSMVERLQPERTWFTHISHHMGLCEEIDAILPAGVALGYDGLTLTC